MPFEAGASQVRFTVEPVTAAVRFCGIPSVVAASGTDAAPGPPVPVASTVNEYAMPACRPVTAHVVVTDWHTSALPRNTV